MRANVVISVHLHRCGPALIETIELRPLALRCEPVPGESLNGFVRRLSERNAITPTFLMSFTRALKPFPVGTDPKAMEGLAILSGHDADALRMMGAPPSHPSIREQGGRPAEVLHGQAVSSRHERGRLKAVCPACLAAGDPFHRLEWEFLFAGACHVHRCGLLAKCPGCDEWLGWNETRLTCCRCDSDWSKSEPEVWDDARLAGTDFIASCLHGLPGRPEPESISGLPLIHAIDLLLALGGLAANCAPWQMGANVRETRLPEFLNSGLKWAAAPTSSLGPLMDRLETSLVGQPTMRPRMLEWCDWIEPHGSPATSAILDVFRATVRARAGEAQMSFDV